MIEGLFAAFAVSQVCVNGYLLWRVLRAESLIERVADEVAYQRASAREEESRDG